MNIKRIPRADDVLDLFKRINEVPRPSWKEEKIADFLCEFARNLNLEYLRDDRNCVVIRKPATCGYENAPTVVLLNHSDMVCVSSPGYPFDPLNDAIESYEEEGWLKAKHTSLGADNGIGLSMALAVLQSSSIHHPALEVLTTTNEEDGMTGAANLNPDFIKGRKIINLDSEDYDTITVGSAGAYLQVTKVPFSREKLVGDYVCFSIEINGGLGGHSGVDINKNRSNAIHEMAILLRRCLTLNVRLLSIEGGEANNAIATNCVAVIAIPVSCQLIFEDELHVFQTEITDKYRRESVKISLQKITDVSGKEFILKKDSDAFIVGLSEIPYGVLSMSKTLSDTVETSSNIGRVSVEDNEFVITNYSRSFDDKILSQLGESISTIFKKQGGISNVIMKAPAWQSNLDSEFLHLTESVFQDVLKFTPKKVVMHFALETGYFVNKYEGVEIISMGPKIIEPHSVNERVSIETINHIWEVLKCLLERMNA